AVKRLIAIGGGPAANIALTIVLFPFLFMTVPGHATRTVATVAPELQQGIQSPAQSVGLQTGDRIRALNGRTVKADEIAKTIGDSGGKKLILTIVRNGKEQQLGP